jgi:Oxaloacetate decarboxylase, gamma chain.
MIEPLIAYGILAVSLIVVFAIYLLTSKKSGKSETTAEIENEPVIINAIEESYEEETDDNELIAVISAAVAAYLNSADAVISNITAVTEPATKFRVVSFRKVK